MKYTRESKVIMFTPPVTISVQVYNAGAAYSIDFFFIYDKAWLESVSQFEYRFGYAIGADRALKHYTHNLSTHWLRGQRVIQLLTHQTEAAWFDRRITP